MDNLYVPTIEDLEYHYEHAMRGIEGRHDDCPLCWLGSESDNAPAPTTPKYPGITVQLSGTDGNAFSILGKVHSALRKAGVPKEIRDAFSSQVIIRDYDHLLQTVMEWVVVE